MMIKSALFSVLAAAVAITDAFVIPVPHQAFKVLKGTSTDDETLARLQHTYKVLQEKLLADVVIKHDNKDAETIEEQMVAVAAAATQVQEHKQIEVIHQAEEETQQAQAERLQAQALKEKALSDAFSEGNLNAAFEDLERLNDLELHANFEGLEAKHKIEAANILLQNLKVNEAKLQGTLQKLKEAKANEEEHKMETSKHRSFLTKVEDAIYAHPDILISLDPHIL